MMVAIIIVKVKTIIQLPGAQRNLYRADSVVHT